jgi:hypothetical protein
MIEIKYNEQSIEIFHDQRRYELEDLMDHLRANGHPRELVGFAVPMEVYDECKGISRSINKIFEERDNIKRPRRKFN